MREERTYLARVDGSGALSCGNGGPNRPIRRSGVRIAGSQCKAHRRATSGSEISRPLRRSPRWHILHRGPRATRLPTSLSTTSRPSGGVGIDADVMLVEATASTLNVRERYLVRNSSSPPRTQFSQNGFEVALPEGAVLEEASATRPGGLRTRTHLTSLCQKGHYAFNVPIQPDQGEKETLFEVQNRFAYNGKHPFAIRPLMPADSFVVLHGQRH